MLNIKAICKKCQQEAVFVCGNTIDFDTAINEEYGLEPSDEKNLQLVCPKCKKSNDFALIIEQDENFDFTKEQ